MPRTPQHWSPSTVEKLRARTQTEWRCRRHNIVASPKHHGIRCAGCKIAEQRRVKVVRWMTERGMFQEG